MTPKTTLRDRLQELIDGVPDDQLIAVIDAVLAVIVPEDDEPLTAKELAALERGREPYLRGDTVPHEDVVRALEERRAARRS